MIEAVSRRSRPFKNEHERHEFVVIEKRTSIGFACMDKYVLYILVHTYLYSVLYRVSTFTRTMRSTITGTRILQILPFLLIGGDKFEIFF